MHKSACRLYCIFARESPTAIILRRGPSLWTQLIRWNTADDTFEEGQWFKGTIYKDRCDLSPSGEKFIYFAAKHSRWATADPAYTHTWTAVSNTPYFTALALWTNRRGTYFGGGLFDTDDRILLNAHDLVYWGDRIEPHPDHRPPPHVQIESFPTPWRLYSSFVLNPEYLRLLRDGWTWHEEGKQRVWLTEIQRRAELGLPFTQNLYRCGEEPRDESAVLHRQTSFTELQYRVSFYIHHGKLSDARDELLEGVGWADFDRRGRLICAAEGKLFEVGLRETNGSLEWREIADFNGNRPHPVVSPDAARVW